MMKSKASESGTRFASLAAVEDRFLPRRQRDRARRRMEDITAQNDGL
jgi:hypothetical protein